MLVVIALGGNALTRRGEPIDLDHQRRRAAGAAKAVAQIANRHRVVLTHGNGPQVGLLALRADAYLDVEPDPLDVLGAESDGMIGYLLEQELGRHLGTESIATLLTQVVVDTKDPAFAHPTKPIGPIYTQEEGAHLADQAGWSIARDARGVRRVVPSPEPLEIVELNTIRILIDAGISVICAGGGGIPVARSNSGLRGVEAVIDKDLSSALLASELNADALLLLTDVPGVFERPPPDSGRLVRIAGVDQMRALTWDLGSMGPKVEAACRFAAKGSISAVGALADGPAVLSGECGTRIVPGDHPIEYS